MSAPEHEATVRLAHALPTGTVSFLFTDIEGSTRLLQKLGDAYASALSDHRTLLLDVASAHGGVEVHSEGDGGLIAFARAADAVAAALDAQLALRGHPWPPDGEVKVRMGIHTGEAVVVSGDYVGLPVHQAARICAAGHGGQVLVSQATRELVASTLPEGAELQSLGEFRLKDVDLSERLFQLVHPGLDTEFPPLRVLNVLPNNLPASLSSFVGREAELGEVRRLLAATRLLTLRGPGGGGKTRLALESARAAVEVYDDGVWFVDLAPVTDPGLVVQRIATVVGVREEPGRPMIDTLTDRLRRTRMLLLLDNCEHLVEPCAEALGRLLPACPELQVLATSREAIGVPGETTWLVPPMRVPERGSLSADELLGYDAIELFVRRAMQVRPEFKLTEADAEAVAGICRHLDGIPLAIELAAARIRVLTPAQVAERLHDRFRLLTAVDRSSSGRHQTLRATVDWSYDLLTGAERVLFRRLAVFPGEWTLDAAEGICPDAALHASEVLQQLTALVDRSLVLSRQDGPVTTYRMLETVRMYAVERLTESGEADEIGRRFRRWYTELAERMARDLSGRDQAARLDALEAEHDNLRGALSSALDAGDGETALRLAAALGRFWSARGHLFEGRLWLWTVLDAARQPTIDRARALGQGAALTEAQGEYDAAREMYEESLRLADALGDRRLVAERTANLGSVDWLQGDYASAAERHTRALEVATEIGDRSLVARGMHNLANVLFMQGDRAGSRDRLREALEIRRQIDDAQGIAETLNNLAILARIEGDLSSARAMTDESLGIVRALGHRPLIAAFSGNLGIILQRSGRLTEAKAMFEESLAIRRELGDKDGVAIVLNSVGNAAYLQGDHVSAKDSYVESLALRREMGDRRGVAETLANLGAALRALNELDAAETAYGESLEVRRALGDRAGIAGALQGLATIARRRGDPTRAVDLLTESLTEAGAVRDTARTADAFESLVVLWADAEPERAATLRGALSALGPDARGPSVPWAPDELESADALLRQRLGEDAYERAVRAGAEMSLDDVRTLVVGDA